MILENIDKQGFATFIPTYITKACKIPTPRVYMTDNWIKDMDLNVFDCVKKMMVFGKQFCQKTLRRIRNDQPKHLV